LSVCQDCQAISSVSPAAAPTDADAIFPLLIFFPFSYRFQKNFRFFKLFSQKKKATQEIYIGPS
jgi:hypothetical protein